MVARSWIQEFFDGNPLSSLSIIGMRDGLAERWADFNTNPTDLSKQLSKTSRLALGDPSLQNALEMGRNSLLHLPKHVSREIIILYGSLYSCDPGDIHETISELANDGIRVHVVGIGAQVKIAETITKATKGKSPVKPNSNITGEYKISLDQHHFKECLVSLIQPPTLQTPQCEFMQMGFPLLRLFDKPTLCACHQTQISSGFECPKCRSLVCKVPRECPVCALTLSSAPSLARSYHHIFPPHGFTETEGGRCVGCKGDGEVRCDGCLRDYCAECGGFIVDILHSCPTCSV
jgi:transcription initiation factor TFIIH subunit 2